MTLVNHELLGVYEGFCYEAIVQDLDLHNAFESVTGEQLANYEYDPYEKIGEDTLIHRVLDEADDEYILHSDTIGTGERMYYAVLKLPNNSARQQD